MKDYVLFVHGTYRRDDLPAFKKLCRGKVKVAVDGGFSFFKKASLKPDIIIGDMDSVTGLPRLSAKTIVVGFPSRKDKTDSQLAVEYCIGQGARSIVLVQPSVGQSDHYVGNILLPTLSGVSGWAKKGGQFKIVSRSAEIHFVSDGTVTLTGVQGNTVSVIPLSRQIVLSCDGTDFDTEKARISRGQTRGLRNRVTARRAVFAIKGEALVWRLLR